MSGNFRLVILVSVGAVLGANARFWLGRWLAATWPTGFPLTTLLINGSGSVLLGALAAVPREQPLGNGEIYALLGVGFLGAYTTFSTFSLETLRLLQNGLHAQAAGYALGSPLLGVEGAAFGWWLVRR